MTVVILANEELKQELLAQGSQSSVTLYWIEHIEQFNHYPDAAAYIDLLFTWDEERLATLKKLPARPIIVTSTNSDVLTLPRHFVCINGWPTFLRRPVVEAYAGDDEIKNNTSDIFSYFNKTICWTPRGSAFPTARVVAMIINEAYFTLEEKVSTKEEIDIAMKLGTNYPYGPFEWSEKIGLPKIASLLHTLSKEKKLYAPAPLLKMEAAQ